MAGSLDIRERTIIDDENNVCHTETTLGTHNHNMENHKVGVARREITVKNKTNKTNTFKEKVRLALRHVTLNT